MSDTVITPELREWIGRKTPLRLLEIISAADVRRYVDATGDANPLWLDDDFARGAGYRSCILPPTLVGCVSFSFKEGTERADGSATSDSFAGRVHQRAQRGFGDRVASAGLPGRAAFNAEFHCRYRRASGQSRLGDLYHPRGTGAKRAAPDRPATPPHLSGVSR